MKKKLLILLTVLTFLLPACSPAEDNSPAGTYISAIPTSSSPFEEHSGPAGNFIVELYDNFRTAPFGEENSMIVGRYSMYDTQGELIGRGEITEVYEFVEERGYIAEDEGGGIQAFSLTDYEDNQLLWSVTFLESGGTGAPIGGTILKKSKKSFESLENNFK